jgi:hypothetical protein
MFSTFARIPVLGRRHALSNHNARASNASHVVHHGRPRLVCRWRPDPATRKLLCRWEIDGGQAASASKALGDGQADEVFTLVPSGKRVAWACGRLNSEQGAKHGHRA